MKALALQPIKSGGDCFDDVIATLNGWYHQGYEMMYTDALFFEFQEATAERQTIASRMAMLNQPLHMLETFHGYSANIHPCAPDLGWQIIQKELSAGYPVGLNVDSYYVPWDEKYQQEHYLMHMIVAVGCDDADNLICLDPYFEKVDQLLPRAELEQGYRACMTMRKGKGRIQQQEELVTTLQPLIKQQRDQLVPAFDTWIEALEGIDFAKETEGCADFGTSFLYHRLSSIVFSRSNFAKSLAYMADTYGLAFHSYAEQFRKFSNKWTTIRALMAKMNYASQIPGAPSMMDNLKQRIQQLVNAEAETLGSLLAFLESGNMEAAVGSHDDGQEQTVVPSAKANVVVPVNVEQYCNNRAISDGEIHANFDAMGYGYGGKAVSGGQLRVEDMEFCFPAGNNSGPDNISCTGQVISLPGEEVKGLMLLGSGEQGDHSDVGRVVFGDGTSEDILIDFPDWWSSTAHSGHIIAWETDLVHAEKGKTSNQVRLFAKKISFREPKTVRELCLPNLPNLHLFALSLWK